MSVVCKIISAGKLLSPPSALHHTPPAYCVCVIMLQKVPNMTTCGGESSLLLLQLLIWFVKVEGEGKTSLHGVPNKLMTINISGCGRTGPAEEGLHKVS